MLIVTTDPQARTAVQRGKEERAEAIRQAWRWLFPANAD